jgi:hypothetical protein
MPRRSFNLVEAINKEKHRFSWDDIGSSYQLLRSDTLSMSVASELSLERRHFGVFKKRENSLW